MAKKTQTAVNYRQGTPEQSCAGCEFFQDPESCSQVSGTISAGGLCDLWSGQGAGVAAGPDMAMLEQMMFGGGLPQ